MAESAKNAITGPFSPRELEILLKAHLCLKIDKDNKPIVDAAKLNILCGFTHARAGYNCYYNAMKKVKTLWAPGEAAKEGEKGKGDEASLGEDANDSAPVSPKKTTPRKRAPPKALLLSTVVVKDEAADDEVVADEAVDAVDEIAIPDTPGSAKRKANDAEGENASAETPSKKKRAPRKPKAPELDENGNPIAKPKRGRPKKSAETVGDENDASAPTTPVTATPKKRAATGGRKKKADVADVTSNVNANEEEELAGVPSPSPIASASSPALKPYATDTGIAADNVNDAVVTLRHIASQTIAEVDKDMPEDGKDESKGNIVDQLSV